MAREQFQSLSEQMYYILLALWEPQCGADIARQVVSLSDGRMQIGPGTLYTLLARFEEQDMIRQTGSEGRRRYYVITDKGKHMLRTEYRRLETLIRDGFPYLHDKTGGYENE
ncbi:MAG: helix-turn-helix transcriptional regulator [Clostridiales bacterium]|nr:helix-turn-helix transcriptional regulator [Clostridiales bacterium]